MSVYGGSNEIHWHKYRRLDRQARGFERRKTASTVVPHLGRPLAVLEKLLTDKEYAGADYFGVSGHLGHISEAAAIQRALVRAERRF